VHIAGILNFLLSRAVSLVIHDSAFAAVISKTERFNAADPARNVKTIPRPSNVQPLPIFLTPDVVMGSLGCTVSSDQTQPTAPSRALGTISG
jgi:hypothetical protein